MADVAATPQDTVPQDAVPREAVPQATVPQDAVPVPAAREREARTPRPSDRFAGLRDWWQDGSAESSPVKSSINGVILGFYLALIVGARVTGHRRDALALIGAGFILCIFVLACLWWTLERPRAGLTAMLAGALVATGVVLAWGQAPPA
ncbi:hypothetical protein ACFVSN_26750 [Kitasatospora sp. NPDC057904]|uniref:hypothetical protein n=1 Tax=unclassified Kitasatospora TaxID=2633591 RepID=UPI0036D7ECBF